MCKVKGLIVMNSQKIRTPACIYLQLYGAFLASFSSLFWFYLPAILLFWFTLTGPEKLWWTYWTLPAQHQTADRSEHTDMIHILLDSWWLSEYIIISRKWMWSITKNNEIKVVASSCHTRRTYIQIFKNQNRIDAARGHNPNITYVSFTTISYSTNVISRRQLFGQCESTTGRRQFQFSAHQLGNEDVPIMIKVLPSFFLCIMMLLCKTQNIQDFVHAQN